MGVNPINAFGPACDDTYGGVFLWGDVGDFAPPPLARRDGRGSIDDCRAAEGRRTHDALPAALLGWARAALRVVVWCCRVVARRVVGAARRATESDRLSDHGVLDCFRIRC